ncbi:hypothetical protein TIFTF001_010171 [Ficus carica]|uniref:Uncharacterized protein n=1 Tax=Ficus carica TaxID=3494 RepID=A0AA87ZR78_FICCA|nr:hypothetical protein TIFTF001_010171 [Ficus carica]
MASHIITYHHIRQVTTKGLCCRRSCTYLVSCAISCDSKVRHNDRLSPVMSYVMLLLFRVQLQVSSCLMKDIDKSLILAVECWCPNQHAYKILVVCPSDISLGHD